MDRLISELKFQPTEAYRHLSRLIEQVNAIIGSFYQSARMEDDYHSNHRVSGDQTDADVMAETLQSQDDDQVQLGDWKDDKDLYFSPERGNVIFASAMDGWAFRTRDFARIFASKFGFNSNVLGRFLWGEFFWDSKVKRVIGPKLLRGRSLKPLFAQIALENIWAVYAAVRDS
jgi:ribosome assembly protein 1